MEFEFGYGSSVQKVDIGEQRLIASLHANQMDHPHRGTEAVRFALEHPVGAGKLRDAVKAESRVAIVASDISRPVPSREILPAVLEELFCASVRKENITVVFALGSHRAHTTEEKIRLAGEQVFRTVRCEDSTESGFLSLGRTSRGTPVDICRTVAEADFRICTGNVEFHYFAGYSGGYKAIMPGCSTAEAIQKNHTGMTDSAACAGRLSGNPVREDIEEAGRICGVDYLVNVVLDEHKQIVYASAGDPTAAHRDCCGVLDRMYRCRIPEKADIVIVSQGGAPKDANLYQVQKALENAKHAVKQGGSILLAGACPEGFGSRVFEEWFREASSPRELAERIGREFVLGGHKAAAVGMAELVADVFLVSELEPDTVKSIFMIPCASLQEAWEKALAKHGGRASVIAMPYGGATLPVPEEDC